MIKRFRAGQCVEVELSVDDIQDELDHLANACGYGHWMGTRDFIRALKRGDEVANTMGGRLALGLLYLRGDDL